MKKKITKRILLVAKLALAVLLLVWVLSKAHWADYVQTKAEYGGETWSVQALGSAEVAVYQGHWFWRTDAILPFDQFQPIDDEGHIVRRGFLSTLKDMNLPLFLLAVLAFPISMVIVAARFWYLLKAQGLNVTYYESVKLTFLGQFFNQVVPGTVGGDLVKGWYVSRQTGRTAGVLVALFLDRMMGLIELVVLAGGLLLVVLAAGLESWDTLRNAGITVLIVAGITLVMMIFVMSSGLRRRLHLQKLYKRLSIAHHFEAAGQSASVYRRRPGVLLWSLLITFVSHMFFLGGIALIGISLGLSTPIYSYFVFLPLIYIIGAVPITPGGVGLVEKLYMGFFVAGGVGASAVIALAMLARFVPVVWGLPGLLVAIRGPKLPKPEDMETELQRAEAAEERATHVAE